MYKLIILVIIVFLLIFYGFYVKSKNAKLYEDFLGNKVLKCGNKYVQKNKGWYIKNNRFFSNGKIFKTIIFCDTVPSRLMTN